MRDFQYADQKDRLTEDLISRNFDGEYWERGEQRLLSEARAYISGVFGHEAQKTLRMLDLGCGVGRLIPEFAALYASVTGLEPDAGRFREAEAFLAAAGTANVSLFNGTLEDYLAGRDPAPVFDVVLCSHVFQHVSHDTLRDMLRLLPRCTGEKTVFIFTTTFIEGEENQYTLERFEGEERVSLVTDPEGFEAAVRDGQALPVCRFARPWLEALLADCGLRTVRAGCYHFYGEHNAENDPLNTLLPEKRPLARDAWYLCRRAAASGEPDAETEASGKISFLQFYYLNEGQQALRRLPPGERAETREGRCKEVLSEFETAESFLYGAGLHFPARRYVSDELQLRFGDLPIRSSHRIVTVYPEAAVCQVCVCLTLEDAPVRSFVWLHQIQCSDGTKFDSRLGRVSVPGLCRGALEELGLSSAEADSTAIITELNRLGDLDTASELSDAAARCIYGVLSGDEGWHRVPVSLARSRLESSWGSRDFVRVVAFAGNFLVLNLNRGEMMADYLAKQRLFADRYWGGLNPYFEMDASTAGVNHGVFFSVETGMVMKTVTDRFLNRRPDVLHRSGMSLQKEIKKNKQYRADMIRTLNKLETVNITELGELDALVLKSLDTSQRMDSIRYLLELLESDMDLMYQTNTNRMVNLLTVLGLLLAAVQVLLAVFPPG